MAEAGSFDIAVFGSSLLAAVLAGLLSGTHGQKVILVADGSYRHRLARGFAVSVAPLTHPESWALLAETRAEAVRLYGQIAGSGCIERLAPQLVADTAEGAEVLSHVRAMANGFGHGAQRIVELWVPAKGGAIRFPDAMRLRRHAVQDGLDPFLIKSGVTVIDWDGLEVVIGDAGVRIGRDSTTILARRAVLADDAAIGALLPDGATPLLRRQDATSVLTEPAPGFRTPFAQFIEDGLTIHQRSNGAFEVIAAALPDRTAERIGHLLAGAPGLRRSGQVVFERIATADGAPAIGPIEEHGPLVIAGFGDWGPFVVPAIARHVAGSAGANEGAYFSARTIGSGRSAAVADYPADTGMAAAAA